MNGCAGSVVDSVHAGMGAVFYRGLDPRKMGYAELRYFTRWNKIIGDEELSAANRALATRG